jgi:hypothetical protein
MSEEINHADNSLAWNKNIRRATLDDIEALIKICRISFPNYLIWCTDRCARKWWESIIRSKSHETWVYQLDNEIVALIRLVIDPNQYNKEIRKLRPRLSTVLWVFIKRPLFLFTTIIGKIKRVFSSSLSYSDSSRLNSLTKRSLWVHTNAVLPGMRGKGIGTNMMRFCEQRSINLGYDSMKFFIKTNNKGSIRLHERLGFIRIRKIKDNYLFIKLLSKSRCN